MGSIVFFPPDIIAEILSRLPVIFLLQFRCVSKAWCCLIDSQEFVKHHLNQSMITKNNLILILGRRILGHRSGKFSVSLDSIHPTGVISFDCLKSLAPHPISGSIVLNSCNGLSLILIPQASQLCIWNPFTRKYKEIPATPIGHPVVYENTLNCLIANERYAFAYVSETDDYKVVRVMEFRNDSLWLFSKAEIFSSTSNEWESIEDFPYPITCTKRVWGAHLNGILHTIVKNDASPLSIMAFDVRSKEHALVPNPDLFCEDSTMVDVLGGCLCLICQHSFDPIVDVWVMKDYGVKDSWFKLMSSDPTTFSIPRGCLGSLQPLVYSKDGEEVLFRDENYQRIYWYILKTGTMRQIPVNLTYNFYIEVCFESLVSLPGFISVDDVKSWGSLLFEKGF